MDRPAAFVLAAGLGTRLRPLTERLPKPLVPLFHKPLLTFALDSLIAAGVGTLAINTHHLPEAFTEVFGSPSTYRDQPLHPFHEPLLLDTGGGIRNARSALGDSSFFLYNGDILADLPLAELLVQHRASGALATLMLLDGGGVANVRFEATSGRVLDLRGVLGAEDQAGELVVYSGIAVFETAIFDWIPSEGPYSIIDALIEAIRAGENVGGLLCSPASRRLWMDIGTPEAYREAHRVLSDPVNRPSYLVEKNWPEALHPTAQIDPSAVLEGMVIVGPGASVRKGAFIRDSILWPGAVIEQGSYLEECIIRGTSRTTGIHRRDIL